LVRLLLSLTLLVFSVAADDRLFDKIESLIGHDNYARNSAFIDIIFSPESDYYVNGHIDVVKVVDRLNENGLMNLFFKSPRRLELTFSTNGRPLFFVKLMDETLHDMGYYRYITKESNWRMTVFHGVSAWFRSMLPTLHYLEKSCLKEVVTSSI